ncbi:helix-turn-helix domain-containing protein [Leekyejoonella antrihumi]|uniref:Helix-turn-helix transcriptional regulator n=1 Tax=Leekyejoonella antrihumi TaxID=1660198 RepID=A0A563E3Y0_9MICO|nr:helix-turn-helix transcriptional regulator [Leekyejoonella antrihumi]TWP37226.1 helix-turn-helix transcriptional regulator [Leekyejoonella antrihumi]
MDHSTPLLRDVFGRLLRRARNAQGRTLADVAAQAGVSMPYLSEIERGRKEASSEVLEAVCRALGSSTTELVGAAHRELATVTPLHAVRSLPRPARTLARATDARLLAA